jgi:predicted metal-dependent HD superfamily phosphohydrolase
MWRGLGAAGEGGALRGELLTRYGEPHRHYHSLQHLGECIEWFDRVTGLAGRPAEVEAALWFHDAVYDIGRADNEERSAAWARTALLAAGVQEPSAQRVERLVLATKHTAPPTGPDENLLVDIDLAILGASQARFAQYGRQIRAEYAAVPEGQFRERRLAILGSFLLRPHIYGTGHFQELLEERARANLRRAVAQNVA